MTESGKETLDENLLLDAAKLAARDKSEQGEKDLLKLMAALVLDTLENPRKLDKEK